MDAMKHIIETDKLMAQFMGAVWVEETKSWRDGRSEMRHYLHNCNTILEFSTSWDWLMFVIDKIETGLDLGFSVVIKNDKCRIYRYKGSPYEVKVTGLHEGKNKFISTYNAVIEFIKWYNNWVKENNY